MSTLDDKIGIFRKVYYTPLRLKEKNPDMPQATLDAFKDSYYFDIILGIICKNCNPRWEASKTWEDQIESIEQRRLHIADIYSIQINNLRSGRGFVAKYEITDIDAPEVNARPLWPTKDVKLDNRLLGMVRANLAFFREEKGADMPLITRDALRYIVEDYWKEHLEMK